MAYPRKYELVTKIVGEGVDSDLDAAVEKILSDLPDGLKLQGKWSLQFKYSQLNPEYKTGTRVSERLLPGDQWYG